MLKEPHNDDFGTTKTTFFRRYSLLICLLAISGLPVLMYGAQVAFDSMQNDVSDWLPNDFPQTKTINWFAKRFGSDAILVVSWPGCTLDDVRLDRMRDGMRGAMAPTDGGDSNALFDRVFAGRDILEQLKSIGVREQTAVTRMRGWLVGTNEGEGATTCVVATLTPSGWLNRDAMIEAVHEVAESIGLDSEQLRLGGPAVDSAAIDAVSRAWLVPLGAASVVCALVFAWWCLRSFRFVLALFFFAMLAWSASLSTLGFSGYNLDAVLSTMPALIYVLAVSAAVHMSGYYRDAVGDVGPSEAPLKALRLGWAPCSTAAVTTALGVGSLMVSVVVPVKRFGIFAAIGVLVSLGLLFLVWPAAIQCLMSLRVWRAKPGALGRRSNPARRGPQRERPSTWWLPLFRLATSNWLIILLLLGATLPVLVYGVTRIRTSVNLTDLFSPQSKIIHDYSWLETHVGPLIPVEVVLRFPEPDAENPYELMNRLQLVERTRKHIQHMPAVGGTLAASTFIPRIPTGRSMRDTARRRVIADQILENRQKFVDLRYLYDEYDEKSPGRLKEELWRICGRVEAMSGLDYASFLNEFEGGVSKFVAEDEMARRLGASVEVTGGVFLVAMAQKQLIVDLWSSSLVAFFLIAIAMMVLTRSITMGLISMIPNVFPALLAFGLMGWLDVAVDIGTMMSASVALGIAVDDTSHFLTWLRRGLGSGLQPIPAIRYAYEHCATAMLATSVICGLGILVFALSPFTPVARFALLMAVLLFAALAGNLILLAAILASPVRRFLPVARAEIAAYKARDRVNVG